MKKKLGIIGLSLAAIAAICAAGIGFAEKQTVFMNEVRSWDAAATRDGYYGSDYIEIYNASGDAISLDGWYLSDDAANLKKCRLTDVGVGAEAFVLIYANGENDSGDSLNFKISSEGEKLFLSDTEGKLVDSIYVPAQEFGTVYARITDGAEKWCVKEPTTDYSNNDAKVLSARSLEIPVFSHESGFYTEAFTLTIAAGENQRIYYTLDGSEPTKDAFLYEDGILIANISDNPNVCNAVQNVVLDWQDYQVDSARVDKSVVVRAIAADEDGNVSEIVTNTYFVGLDNYKDKNVLSIAADFEELFGANGIFVTGEDYDQAYLSGTLDETVKANFLQGGRKWEVIGNLQIFNAGEEITNQRAGIRTQGASTRLNPKKRMSLFAREEYSGSRYFEGLSFDGKKSHSVSLNTAVSNIVLPALVKDRNVAVQDALESVVFLNGEYWYDAYMLEKYNKDYLKEAYGVLEDNVILLKNGEISEGPENSLDIYGELLAYISNTDLSQAENYERLEEMADMQSYIDYICANVYLCNMDMSETKNYLLWRTIENEGTQTGDGRWRWMMYDTDCLEWIDKSYYEAGTRAEINSFAETMQFTGIAMNEQLLYSAAKENETFCKQFVLTFMDMANVNFSTENVERVFAEWNCETNEIYGDFFQLRFDYIVPYMAEEFGLTGTLEEVALKVNDTEGGSIQLNTTTPDMSEGSWTGKYYTDYPITVSAVPEEGYKFIGWSGSVSSDSATMEVEVTAGGITLEAVFEKLVE